MLGFAVVIDEMAERIKIALLAAEVKGSSGALVAERTEALVEIFNAQAARLWVQCMRAIYV